MKKNENSIQSKMLTVIVIIILLTFIARDFYIKSEVKKLNKFTIAKFTLKKNLPKRTSFYFTYILNQEKIVTANAGIHYDILNSESETKIIDDLKINCFYLAKYDPKHPTIILVDPLQQVTDTTAILKAGFSREDIEN
ncbi:hypothetical protein SAMN05444372_112126 [Flavobacterium micromati]|uniref:Uncharacterized protein n=1 Tax=Flavobacterium micromati TaxID=229205 RepID=A0A1M5PAD8_9FLAO|nr:hypothetical protein [Flavobacterium micromati]SHG98738.1 hypothetical protein SAMN05444372_112126 [Flavobacterium micromati]